MGSRFLVWLLGAYVVTLGLLGGIGFAMSHAFVSTPREIHRNPAFEFDLAPGWWCQTEGTEDVCRPAGKKPYDAIAIIAIKRRNDQDNLAAYEAHLKKPQRAGDQNAPAGQSTTIQYVRRRELGGREWVESLHHGSEIANYHTYYLATATSHVGVLVTLSVHQKHEAKYVEEFSRMMSSLKTYQR